MGKIIRYRLALGLLGIVLLSYPIVGFQSAKVYAQNDTPSNVFRPGTTNFALLGEFEYGMDITSSGSNFTSPDFGIMPLYRQGNFFFEAGLGFGFDENGPAVDVGPINLSYMLPNGWLVRVGHFDALPYGRYPRVYDPSWINPLATGPIGFEELGAFSDYGVQLQGAGYLGDMRLRGFVSVTNGPGVSLDPGSVGMLAEPGVVDNNKAKMIGGRLSLSPFLSSNFSVGVSDYTTGNIGDPGTSYDGVGANIFAVDFNVAPTAIKLMKGTPHCWKRRWPPAVCARPCVRTPSILPIPAKCSNASTARCGPPRPAISRPRSCVAFAEPRTGRLRFASAGHLGAAVLSAQGAKALVQPNLLLGMMPETRYQTLEQLLSPGEALVVFTEGVRAALEEHGLEAADPRFFESIHR